MRDDWDYDEVDVYEDEPEDRPSQPDPDGLTGTDPARVVRVIVNDGADVLAVRLADGWEHVVDPRALGAAVLAAMNDAVVQVLAVDRPAPQPVRRAPSSAEPITAADTLRLVDAVFADLDAYTRRLTETVDHPVQVRSRGGHVHGTAQAGQVLELIPAPDWAAVARGTELEAELAEVLRELRQRSTPHEAVPDSPAIAEVLSALADPQALLRRVGLSS
ncbi:hypothetical protein FKR81_38115 [Lentzea tibetensis]|uniref:Uncharacterized protein n=1 Tax=Lentzea tibetensis TaxID=2591470 RepID=A0A563EGY4_9PSEU|nr:hypothetical protein [Lentzea tibetensis]TWP45792.1 hypothetical protein FKR81_38115 [Lentzea tibetensis]